jgi:hypothetical protein
MIVGAVGVPIRRNSFSAEIEFSADMKRPW